MLKPRSQLSLVPEDDRSLVARRRKPVPHAFVLEAIAALAPYIRPMFGSVAVYIEEDRHDPARPARESAR
jgi:hypothetical protein